MDGTIRELARRLRRTATLDGAPAPVVVRVWAFVAMVVASVAVAFALDWRLGVGMVGFWVVANVLVLALTGGDDGGAGRG